MALYTYNPSTWETEAGGIGTQGRPWHTQLVKDQLGLQETLFQREREGEWGDPLIHQIVYITLPLDLSLGRQLGFAASETRHGSSLLISGYGTSLGNLAFKHYPKGRPLF